MIMSHNNQSYNIELITFGWIRENIEYIIKNVPVAIKKLTVNFARKSIKSNILSIKDDLDVITLISNELINKKIIKYKLIFRASENEYKAQKFHEAFNKFKSVSKFDGNIIIIQTTDNDIFGGYTSKHWNEKSTFGGYAQQDQGYVKDKYAFLFLIKSIDSNLKYKCPIVFKLRPGHEDYAISVWFGCGPIFGKGWDIWIHDQCNYTSPLGNSVNSSNLQTYCNDQYKLPNTFRVKELESFEVIMD